MKPGKNATTEKLHWEVWHKGIVPGYTPRAQVVEYIFPDGKTAYLRFGWMKGHAHVWRGDFNGGLVQLIFDPTLPKREPSKGSWHRIKQ